MTRAHEHPESRFDRDSWIVASVAILYLVVSVGLMLMGFRFPSDGWKYDDNDEGRGPVVAYKIKDGASSLQPNDEVVAVDGLSARSVVLRPADGSSVWRRGGTVSYTVRRGEQLVELLVPIASQPASDWWRFVTLDRNLVNSAAGVVTIFLAAYVFARRPRNLGARALLLAFVMWFAEDSILGTYNSVGLRFTPSAYFYGMEFMLMGWEWWLLPTLIGFVLVFPLRRGPMRRRPRLTLAFLYGVPVAIALGAIAVDEILVFDLALAALGIAFLLTTVISIIHTLRTDRDAVVRAQLAWMILGLVFSLGLSLIWFLLSAWLPASPVAAALTMASSLISLIFPVCASIAILRYRLFDIDVIINRTLVYGSLTAIVIGLYVLVVGYLGSLFKAQYNLLVSLLATGMVAVLFQPLRDRLQRGVNRLMYGRRNEPVAVLSQLGARLEQTIAPSEMLPRLVETVAQALKLPYVAIALRVADDYRVQAQAGVASGSPASFPLIHQGETIGELRVARRSGDDDFGSADRLLLTNIARQASTVAHSVRLTAALQQSRQQLVTAREEERRRLRRDLHDGLGPQLASQTLTIEAITKLSRSDPNKAKELLFHLKAQSQGAIQDIRRLVYGLRPPALDELGLVEALREGVRQSEPALVHVEITTTPQPLPTLPAAVEVAIYRLAQEAITNVLRHAHASHCSVLIAAQEHDVDVSITDNGRGYPAKLHRGVGLNSMRERAEELGGTLRFENRPEGGALIHASLPLLGEPE